MLEAEGNNLKMNMYNSNSLLQADMPTAPLDDLDEMAHLQLHPLKNASLGQIFPVLAYFWPTKKGKETE